MKFTHDGKLNLSAVFADSSNGKARSFISKLFGVSSDDTDGNTSGTANGDMILNYTVSAEMSVEELKELHSEFKDNAMNIKENMSNIMDAVDIAFAKGLETAKKTVDSYRQFEIDSLSTDVAYRKATYEKEQSLRNLENEFNIHSQEQE